MNASNSTMAREIAQAAIESERQRTGHGPESVSVVLSDDTLVITLHGALSPAEKSLAQSAAGFAQLQEYHRQVFVNSSDGLKQEIKRITGVEVREAGVELDTTTGTVLKVFSTGTVVQVFLLSDKVAENVSDSPSGDGQALIQEPRV